MLAALAALVVPAACTATPSAVEEDARGAPVTSSAPAAPEAVTTSAVPCTIPTQFAGLDVERLPVTAKLIALTFDGGASSTGVPSILDTLATKDVKATFFLTGDFVQTYPKRSLRIGTHHLVGNHTMNHLDLTTLGNLAVRREIRQGEAAILAGTGQDPRRFFRFPFGARDARVIGIANNLCYVPFRWTVDSLGWKGTSGGMTVAKVVERVVAAARPGAIVLMHVGANPDDGTTLDAAALPTIITKLRAKGYTFVRLSRVMSAAP